jgi:dissimilatory sulfite reductase (desulfoviridin) alpha/beta subunit
LGITGRGQAFVVCVGGKMGKRPRRADVLPLAIPDEAGLFAIVDAVIDWFAAHGTPGERFGATIDRVGLDELVRRLSRA